jgi:hypothetical protein
MILYTTGSWVTLFTPDPIRRCSFVTSTPRREIRGFVAEYKKAFEEMGLFDPRPFTALLEDVFGRLFL